MTSEAFDFEGIWMEWEARSIAMEGCPKCGQHFLCDRHAREVQQTASRIVPLLLAEVERLQKALSQQEAKDETCN